MDGLYFPPRPAVVAVVDAYEPPIVAASVSRIAGHVWLLRLLSLGSGVLMAGCFEPYNLHFLAWIALVPWLVVMARLPVKQVWLYGLLVGLGYYWVGLAWLCKLSWVHGPMVIFWFTLLFGFSFRVARLLMDRFGLAAMIWAVPLAFVGQEVLRSEMLSRFRFAFLAFGYSQSHDLWVSQIASLGGVYFVTFLLVMVNATIAYALIRRRSTAWMPAGCAVGAALVLGIAAQPKSDMPAASVPVACVQAESVGYMQYYKYAETAANQTPKPAIIALPEHALTEMQSGNDPELIALKDLARRTRTLICAGGDARVTRPGQICSLDNQAQLIDTNGDICLKQLKSVPIAFFQDGNPATHQDVARTEQGVIGMCICYDGAFTDITRRLVNLGAEILLCPVLDPDSWPAQERLQHADLAIFRAIELRRCIIRPAGSGISQIIDATGRVTASRTKEEGPGLLTGYVYPTSTQTPFVRIGWLFAPAVCIAFLVIVTALTLEDWYSCARRFLAARQPRRQPALLGAAVELVADVDNHIWQ